jgi:hypothetical protein
MSAEMWAQPAHDLQAHDLQARAGLKRVISACCRGAAACDATRVNRMAHSLKAKQLTAPAPEASLQPRATAVVAREPAATLMAWSGFWLLNPQRRRVLSTERRL